MTKSRNDKRPAIVVFFSVTCFLFSIFLLCMMLFVYDTADGNPPLIKRPLTEQPTGGWLAIAAAAIAFAILGVGTLLLQKWAYYVWYVIDLPLIVLCNLGICTWLFAPPVEGFVAAPDVRKAFKMPPLGNADEKGEADQAEK
jgi:hypothetical protein